MAAAYEFAFFGQEVGCACRNRKCVIAEERAGEADSVIIPSVAARAELDPSEILSAVCVQHAVFLMSLCHGRRADSGN